MYETCMVKFYVARGFVSHTCFINLFFDKYTKIIGKKLYLCDSYTEKNINYLNIYKSLLLCKKKETSTVHTA